jgi:hypothetical protein
VRQVSRTRMCNNKLFDEDYLAEACQTVTVPRKVWIIYHLLQTQLVTTTMVELEIY